MPMSPSLSSLTPEELSALSSYPTLPPPPGVMPNFMDPENQNQPLIVVASLLLVIMGAIVLNRAYCKIFIVRKYSWDDLTVTLAVIGSVVYYVACIWGAQKGKMGVHQWDINIPQAVSKNLLIPAYLITILSPPTLLFVKVTFFFLYLQVFRPMRWLRICAYIGLVVTTAFYFGMTVAQFTFGTPRPGETWYSHQQTQNETNSLKMSVPQSAVGLAIDLYILILPMMAVSKLQLPLRRKIGVALIFMTGLLACLSSLLSIYYRNILTHSRDVTWNFMPVNTVTLVEIFIGIICTCTPSAAQICRHHLPSLATFKTLLYSGFHNFKSSFQGSNKSSFSGSANKPRHNDASFSHKQYSNLDHYKNAALSDPKSVHTAIYGGQYGGRQDQDRTDGIHLSYEMETRSHEGCIGDCNSLV